MSRKQNEVTDIEYTDVIGETEKAWHLQLDEGVDKWIPKSISELDRESHTITIETWFVMKEELDGYAR